MRYANWTTREAELRLRVHSELRKDFGLVLLSISVLLNTFESAFRKRELSTSSYKCCVSSSRVTARVLLELCCGLHSSGSNKSGRILRQTRPFSRQGFT